MSLNLKNPRAHELAVQLSKLTGESITTVVIKALEERLRQESLKRQGSTAERILRFADRFAEGMPQVCSSAEHAAIFGEDGLPR
jgi:antitoxin VapB